MRKLLILVGLMFLIGCGQGVEVAVETAVPVTAETAVSPTSKPTSAPVVQPTEAATSEPILQPTTEPTEEPAEETTTMSTNAANADVTFVKATETSTAVWTFAVSVDHPDTGWEDYADGWDVLLPDGTVLKLGGDSPFTRLLVHPHVDERPFTRSQSNIQIPADVTQVRVRAHDLLDGFGGQEVIVDLTATTSESFEVIRLP